ncbi:MAG: hypothetical protein Q7S00_03175 [bacterium]|nr:hypothetical protein [bacterium]
MNPEQCTEKLREIYGSDLQSVILYGSSAGEDVHRYSDFNLLVVLNDISFSSIGKSAKFCQKWMRKNPAPLFVSPQHLETSRDVFPIEFYDMKERHRVLYGTDPLVEMQIRPDFLRLQCESELKGKLIALRSEWIRLYPSRRRGKKLMLLSSSSFLAIFRGLLRLLGETVPPTKREVLIKLTEKTRLDISIFNRILDWLEGSKKLSRSEVLPMMEEYLTTLERVASFVDKL